MLVEHSSRDIKQERECIHVCQHRHLLVPEIPALWLLSRQGVQKGNQELHTETFLLLFLVNVSTAQLASQPQCLKSCVIRGFSFPPPSSLQVLNAVAASSAKKPSLHLFSTPVPPPAAQDCVTSLCTKAPVLTVPGLLITLPFCLPAEGSFNYRVFLLEILSESASRDLSLNHPFDLSLYFSGCIQKKPEDSIKFENSQEGEFSCCGDSMNYKSLTYSNSQPYFR